MTFPSDLAFRLRFQADVLDKVALMKERIEKDLDGAAEDRAKAEELRRQAFKLEETGR